jgi:serine/threonine protein kinase
MIDLTGKQLGEYQLVERADGPTASDQGPAADTQVYRAVPIGKGDPVAIKVFGLERLGPEAQGQLRDSLRAVAQLRHPGVPPILGSGVIARHPYIVMPYLAAGSLADRYRRGLAGSLNTGELLDELATILDSAHQRGITHGSLKPSSLMFDAETGSLRLVGLGEAVMHFVGSAHAAAAGGIYAAPEVTAGSIPDPASDQYSFGVLATELLTGLPAEEALSYLRAQSVGRAIETRGLRAPLARQVVLALSKATAAAPVQRFASIKEANRALQIALGRVAPVLAPEPLPAPAPPRKQPRRRRAAATLIAFLMLGLVGSIPAFAAGWIGLPSWVGGNTIESLRGESGSDPAILLPTELSPGSPADGVGGLPDGLPPPTPGVGLPPALSDGSGGLVPPTDGPSATTDPGAQLPGLTSTPLPTSTAPAPTAPPTNTPPPTTAPTNPPPPGGGGQKCKDDPSHPNYCTPTPSP